MKNMLLALAIILCATVSKAKEYDNQITASLIDHIDIAAFFGIPNDDQGPVRVAVLDSVFQIGEYEGTSILDIQTGFYSDPFCIKGENRLANGVVGAQLRIDTLTRGVVPFPSDWRLLRSIEHGPWVAYDYSQGNWKLGYLVGLSFSLNPNGPDKPRTSSRF